MALVDELKKLLANEVTMTFKAWGYHWNVEGDDFPQFHDFFGKIYEDVDGSIDPTAENIRKLGDYAPFRLGRFAELSSIPETNVTAEEVSMSQDLYMANREVINNLYAAFAAATAENKQGIADFLAGRIDMHEKWDWQLRVIIKPEPEEDEEEDTEED